MDNPYKKRFQLWIDPTLMEEVENLYQKDGSRSRSEFIGKAIRAYISYVLAKDTTSMHDIGEKVFIRFDAARISLYDEGGEVLSK